MSNSIYKQIDEGNLASLKEAISNLNTDSLKERDTEHKLTPIAYAIKNKKFEAAEILIDKMDNLDIQQYASEKNLLSSLLIAGQHELANKAADKINIFSDPNKDPLISTEIIAIAITTNNQEVATNIADKMAKIDLKNFRTSSIQKSDYYYDVETVHAPLKGAILKGYEDIAITMVKKAADPSKIQFKHDIIELAEEKGMNKLLITMQEEQIKHTKSQLMKQEANLLTLKSNSDTIDSKFSGNAKPEKAQKKGILKRMLGK